MDYQGVPMFSLEDDDDASALFITQTPKNDRINEEPSEGNSSFGILGVDSFDFSTPCSSLLNDTTSKSSMYSDISEPEDDFMEPVYGRTEGTKVTPSQDTAAVSKPSLQRGISRIIGLNSRKVGEVRRPVGITKSVSTIRKFKTITANKLSQLKTKQLKKRTYNKMKWGVRTYNEWRNQRLINNNDNDAGDVLNSDLNAPDGLTKMSFKNALCMFIPEVTKMRDGSDYPGKTLYEMVTSIQKYLHEKKVYWKLLDDPQFTEVCTVLDNVMKERAEANIGLITKQAQFISLEHENDMWEKGILGEETPDKLRSTVLFLLGIHCGLRAGDEHYALCRESSQKPSQLTFERSPNGKRCLVYREDTVTKTNDGGLNSMKKDRKEVWVYPIENVNRCTVRLVDKYISLLPAVTPKTKKFNFYLRSLERPNPAQWYGEQVVGRHNLTSVVKNLLKDAKLDGYFTNHSLRRTGTTRLFQAGVDRKIIKEYTGHRSDAVDKYQVTSHAQKEEVSNILNGNIDERNKENEVETGECKANSVDVLVTQSDHVGTTGCEVNNSKLSFDKKRDVGDMISKILEGRKSGKTKIKIEIEFSD